MLSFLKDSKRADMANQEFLDASRKKLYERLQPFYNELEDDGSFDEHSASKYLKSKHSVHFEDEAVDLTMFLLREWVMEKTKENAKEEPVDREPRVEDQNSEEFVWYIMEKDEVNPFLPFECIKALFKIQFPEFCDKHECWRSYISAWRTMQGNRAKLGRAQDTVKRKRVFDEEDEERSVRQKTSIENIDPADEMENV